MNWVGLILAFLLSSNLGAQHSLPSSDSLQPGCNSIATECMCSSGTPCQFNSRALFDFENPQKLFADNDLVFLPSCRGNVPVGRGVRRCTKQCRDATGSVTSFHDGYANSTTALKWTYQNYAAATKIDITDSCADAVGPSFYSSLVTRTQDNGGACF